MFKSAAKCISRDSCNRSHRRMKRKEKKKRRESRKTCGCVDFCTVFWWVPSCMRIFSLQNLIKGTLSILADADDRYNMRRKETSIEQIQTHSLLSLSVGHWYWHLARKQGKGQGRKEHVMKTLLLSWSFEEISLLV